MNVLVNERAELKATAVDAESLTRTLDFYAVTFDAAPDTNGDVIDPRALDGWLADFYQRGNPLPVSFAHAAIRDDVDPSAIIGHAPADAEHVWVDDHGLRVKGILDMENDKARQVGRLIDKGIVRGASVTYIAERVKAEGSNRIVHMSVLEAGPCLRPANPEAVVLGIKTAEGDLLLAEKDASAETVDATLALLSSAAEVIESKAWDGDAAMRRCTTAGDYRSIAFELRNDSAPDTAAHWALPHHNAPDGPANPDGVSAALGRLNQTGSTVMSKDAIRSHLERHQTKSAVEEIVAHKHRSAPSSLQSAHDALVRAGARCADDHHKSDDDPEPETEPETETETASEEPQAGSEPENDIADEVVDAAAAVLRRMRIIKAGI